MALPTQAWEQLQALVEKGIELPSLALPTFPRIDVSRERNDAVDALAYSFGIDLARGDDHTALAMLTLSNDATPPLMEVLSVFDYQTTIELAAECQRVANRIRFRHARPIGMSWAHWRKVHRERCARGGGFKLIVS